MPRADAVWPFAAKAPAAGVSVPNPPTLFEYGINSSMPMHTQTMVARAVLPPGRPVSVGAGTLTPFELPPEFSVSSGSGISPNGNSRYGKHKLTQRF